MSVRSSQRPVPASEPTSRMFSRPSRAHCGTGGGLGVGDGGGGSRLGGWMYTPGGGVAVGSGVGESSASAPKLAAGISQSPLGSAAGSSPRKTAVSVSSVSMPSAATVPWPSVATASTARRPMIANRLVRPPESERRRRATSHASRIANAWYASQIRSRATMPTSTSGLRTRPRMACAPPPSTVPITKPTRPVRTTSAGMAMRTPRRRSPTAYWPRPGNRRDRNAAMPGERNPLLVTSTGPQLPPSTPMGAIPLRSLRTIPLAGKRARNRKRTVCFGQGSRLRRRPASRRKVDAPPDWVRVLAVRSMAVP